MKITLVGLCLASLQVMTSYGIQVQQLENAIEQIDDQGLTQIENESDSEFLQHLLSMCAGGCNAGNMMGTYGGGNMSNNGGTSVRQIENNSGAP